VFEGIRAYNRRVFKLKEHIDRLFYSARAILLEIPMLPEEVASAVLDACRENKIRNGYIRLVVTRGQGTLGLNPNRCKRPSVIVIADKIQLYPPELYRQGMAICTARSTRPSSR
jgi:branched-chain amino acid aminotransferase